MSRQSSPLPNSHWLIAMIGDASKMNMSISPPTSPRKSQNVQIYLVMSKASQEKYKLTSASLSVFSSGFSVESSFSKTKYYSCVGKSPRLNNLWSESSETFYIFMISWKFSRGRLRPAEIVCWKPRNWSEHVYSKLLACRTFRNIWAHSQRG